MPPELSWTEERFADLGEIKLCYQEMGDPDDEPIVLTMGLGTQMIAWEDGFCELIAREGFRVIRFDNRDIGHSTVLDGPPPARLAMLTGVPRRLAYTLDDMADDLAGLIESLGLETAHVVGASMGGMIAQVAGYHRPERVRSLGLIMTGAGKRVASLPRLRALGTLMREAPRQRERSADHFVKVFETIGGSGFPGQAERIRAHALAAYDRGNSRAGVARQLHAVTSSGDRTRKLRRVTAPTVVIHGTDDPLVRPGAGRQVAGAVPGARLVMVPGMGHDLPPEVWPVIAGELVANARGSVDGRLQDAGRAVRVAA